MISDASAAARGVIRLAGVRQNNLKGIDVDIPLERLTVITGVSGSGKSSLAFDTLYAEGQRRYLETFSAYTRQFLERLPRPLVDEIENIPPAVAIDQSGAIKTSRSTVGTMTGINDYLKILYSGASEASCPGCGRVIEPDGSQAALEWLDRLDDTDHPVLVIAPVPLAGFESLDMVTRAFAAQGYVRFLRNGSVERIEDLRPEDLRSPALDVVVDRIASAHAKRSRRADSVEQAFRIGRGTAALRTAGGSVRKFAAGLRCGDCSLDLLPPKPGLFSFNNPYGACTSCRGFGKVIELDMNRVIPDRRLSLREGAIRPFATASRRGVLRRCLRFCEENGISTDAAFGGLSRKEQSLVIEGGAGFEGVRGFFRKLEEKKYRMHVRVLLARYRGYEICPACSGARLRPEALQHRILGRTLPELWDMPIRELRGLVSEMDKAERFPRPVKLVVEEVASRLRYLDSVGLGYLNLGRQSRTLSGGEVERVNLTAALGACLVNTLFVLDEPSIGLHARDNERLMGILREIRARGNTVVVVEHDPEILAAADHVIDLGPGSGELGGEIVASGPVEAIRSSERSITGAWLSGRRSMPRRGGARGASASGSRRKAPAGALLEVRGAAENNLRDLDVDIPLGVLTAVTGVSGSGKSTLIEDVIWKAWQRRGGTASGEGVRARVRGFERVDEVVLVDQSPIGRTPRGNPATYTKVHERVRKLFAATEEAIAAGLDASAFSFNTGDGRCAECGGAGAEIVEMQFLSDVTLACDVCGGKRFRKEVLRVRLRGKTMDDVLRMTVREAADFFRGEVDLVERLSFLDGLGLGYLSLGQPLNTLSGGEAQRLKLAGKVLESRRKRLLFLLDEPTTGLHLEDVARLIEVLQGLVDAGHGVLVIEHHLDVIAAADHVIDLGPEGGDGGGRLVAQGAPEEIAARAAETGSITGEWLGRHLARRSAPSSGPGARAVAGEDGSGACPTDGSDAIRVVGARENNLKDITVEIPRDRLVVVTGLSGSGKSSLLHDIVFAEGQRRYLDCLSPYARQFIEDLHRPDIDHLEGIPPAVSIEQRTSVGGRKSTVGTVTEVYQFLRLLYSRAGIQTCPDCGDEVVPRRLEDIVESVRRLASSPGRLLVPAVRGKKGFHSLLLARARRRGVLDARIDGEWVAIPEDREIRLERHRTHDIDLVVGRVGKSAGGEKVRALVERGLELGDGVVRWVADSGEELVLNLERSCPSCGSDFDEPDPRDFSFHSRHGACRDCDGYGSSFLIDPEKLIERWDEALDDPRGGALSFFEDPVFPARFGGRMRREARAAFPQHASRPLSSWPSPALRALLHGSRDFPGIVTEVEDRLAGLDEETRRDRNERWGREVPCSSCGGGRLRRESLAVKVGGRGIAELARKAVSELRGELSRLRWNGRSREIGAPIVEEIDSRLEFLEKVGLDYLTLDRTAITLSTGEAQRIRLASQLGSRLRGVCYILDEPTIGLHSRDGASLLDTLRGLRDRGNSVLVIEHDEATIEAADHVIDMGPGPGRGGGEVVAQGTLEEVLRSPRSATAAALLRARESWPGPEPHEAPDRWLEVEGASLHNLKDIAARFPVGALTVVTGVSGAGKSTLVRGVLEESARRSLRGLRPAAAGARAARGMDLIEAVREVDQLPLGRTPRSTPATYVGFWSRIRAIFASIPEARSRGYGERRFSFNAPGGRCEACQGQGRIRMEMSFLPDVRVDCEECRGRRFNGETLEVLYRGKSIADVLEMSVEEAHRFFDAYRDLVRPLGAMCELGLGYLTLGQASTTLSGGEAQRVKLAVELGKSASGACLYVLDEPTTGLHMEDVSRLVAVLRRLARAGHAVVVIEHHLDVILGADWIVDLGPEGGDGGGRVLFQGPPAEMLRHAGQSHTADALRERVGRRPRAARKSG